MAASWSNHGPAAVAKWHPPSVFNTCSAVLSDGRKGAIDRGNAGELLSSCWDLLACHALGLSMANLTAVVDGLNRSVYQRQQHAHAA